MGTNARGQDERIGKQSKLTGQAVEVSKRYQDLGHDVELLRDHLRALRPIEYLAPRIAACQLSAQVLSQALTVMLITALSEEASK